AQFGLDIPKQKLVLDEPIKAFGSYQVKAKLGFEVSGTVYASVFEEKSRGGPSVWGLAPGVMRAAEQRPRGAGSRQGGLSGQDAPPIFFSVLRKRKRAVHGPKEKAAWAHSGAAALRAHGGRRIGA